MRKAQLTLFIVIGLFILLGVGIFALWTSQKAPATPQAQTDIAQVSSMVQSCLAATAEDALRLIGRQGGYANIARFKDSPDVRQSQIVTMDPQKIVLWHEVHPCADNPQGCVGNNQPPLCAQRSPCPIEYRGVDRALPSIEEELEQETARRIEECVRSNEIPGVLITPKEKPSVDALIRAQDIDLSLEYPLGITTSDGYQIDVEDFTTTLSVDLPRIYALASKVHETQANTGFIEEAFLHLLAIYSGSDTPLPPMREVKLFGASRFWVRSQVQQVLEQDVLPFMSFLQIYNTINTFAPLLPPPTTDPAYAPYAQGAYQYLIVKLDNETYPLGSRFHYPNTPMYLDINGKELLKPETLSGVGGFLVKLSGMKFIQYNFKYDAQFPLVLTIDDPEAFYGEGYEFSLGLEANVRNNYPLNTSIALTQASAGASIDIADPTQLVNHTHSITVKDKRTGSPIKDVAITYACGARFQIGVTDDEGMWQGKAPYCFAGGAFIVERFGYLAAGQDAANTEDDGATTSLSFELWPRQERTALVYKRTAANVAALAPGRTAQLSSQHRTVLSPKEFVYLSLARRPQSAFEDDVPFAGALQFGTTGGAQQATNAREQIESLHAANRLSDEDYRYAIENLDAIDASGGSDPASRIDVQQIDLVPGTYDLEGMLVHNDLIVIAPKVTPQYTLNGTNFTSWVSGGVALTGTNAITLTPEDVYTDAPFVVYVLEQPLPGTWDEVESYQQIEDFQTYERKEAVKPDTR